MWMVGGTKIEPTRAHYILLENFQRENFSGLLPRESLRTQDSENVVGLTEPPFQSYIRSKWGHSPKPGVLQKIGGVTDQSHSIV